jgi:serine/threonine protein phosphatase 1
MIWVIGDIHGLIDPLKNLLWEIKRLEDPGYGKERGGPVEKLIFVGDYIDHGPSSKEVVDLIESLECDKVLLMGDHEDMALRFIKQDRGFLREMGDAWLYSGGGQDPGLHGRGARHPGAGLVSGLSLPQAARLARGLPARANRERQNGLFSILFL